MPTRPILDPNLSTPSAPASAATASVQAGLPESPLASQLPSWDLLPGHTLLVRRRPATSKPPVQTDVPESGSKAVPQPPPLPSAVSGKRDAFCEKCGARLAEGATFCTGCGSKVG
jgi:hypothetical protein